MITSLKLEVFAVNPQRSLRLGGDPKAPYVCCITGINRDGQFIRVYLRGDKDYTEANSVGSRGVYLYYLLHTHRVYEVCRRVSWSKTEKYYCIVTQEGINRITRDQVYSLLDGTQDSAVPALYRGFSSE